MAKKHAGTWKYDHKRKKIAMSVWLREVDACAEHVFTVVAELPCELFQSELSRISKIK